MKSIITTLQSCYIQTISEATVIALGKGRSRSVNGYIKNIAVLFLVDRAPRQNKVLIGETQCIKMLGALLFWGVHPWGTIFEIFRTAQDSAIQS